MSNAPTSLSVLVGEKSVCIRIKGRASFQYSVDFKTLVHNLTKKGQRRFILDLSECQLMDSTFLGVLAGLGLKFSEAEDSSPPAALELVNPSQRISDLLESLGIAHLFKVISGPGPTLVAGQTSDVAHIENSPDGKEVTRTCLEAHQILMEINPANVPKFQDVTKFLEDDLNKSEDGS